MASRESDLAAQVKAHNPRKYCTVWQKGIRLSETVTCASGLHNSGCVKLACGHQPLTSLMSLKGAQVDSATETAEGGRDREKGRREGGVFVAMAKGSSSSC